MTVITVLVPPLKVNGVVLLEASATLEIVGVVLITAILYQPLPLFW